MSGGAEEGDHPVQPERLNEEEIVRELVRSGVVRLQIRPKGPSSSIITKRRRRNYENMVKKVVWTVGGGIIGGLAGTLVGNPILGVVVGALKGSTACSHQ